jgi:hypothetical protein
LAGELAVQAAVEGLADRVVAVALTVAVVDIVAALHMAAVGIVARAAIDPLAADAAGNL